MGKWTSKSFIPLIPVSRFRVTLECGHIIKTRDEPKGVNNKFGCTAGLGCGYQLKWVSVKDTETGKERSRD